MAYELRNASELGVYLAVGALAVSWLVSYLRARAEALGIPGDVGLFGRPERVVVLGVGLLVGFPLYALGLILAVGTFTALQRIQQVYRHTRGS